VRRSLSFAKRRDHSTAELFEDELIPVVGHEGQTVPECSRHDPRIGGLQALAERPCARHRLCPGYGEFRVGGNYNKLAKKLI
jgi:hypothetical protein